jgi:hypothetical protein
MLRPLDLGDLRLQAAKGGYLGVAPDGAIANANEVLVRQRPEPGELELCGRALQRVAITIEASEMAFLDTQNRPTGRKVERIVMQGRGMRLERVAHDRWEGELGPTGRATILVGATAQLNPGLRQGPSQARLNIDVQALDTR